VWRTVDAPRFKAGFTAASVMGVAMIVLTLILRLLQEGDDKRRTRETETVQDIEAPVAWVSSFKMASTELGKDLAIPEVHR
jgi:ACS family pantothenate transporter-like MFS transporter